MDSDKDTKFIRARKKYKTHYFLGGYIAYHCVLIEIEQIFAFLTEIDFITTTDSEADLCNDSSKFEIMLAKFSAKFKVNMSSYLWYFHSRANEINSVGEIFFKPPNKRVERIAVTPAMLANFANSGNWTINYPEHTLPKRRYDLLINRIFICLVIAYFLIVILKKFIFK